MPYSTVALVQSEFRSLDISATTAVTTTDVNGFITETDALIDSYLSRYILPISSVTALAILQMISRQLVACRVRDILEVKNIEVKAAEQGGRGGCNREELMKMLDKIKSGSLILPEADVDKSMLGMASGNTDNDIEPFFERDKAQW